MNIETKVQGLQGLTADREVATRLVASARAMAPRIRELAVETERRREVPAETVEAYKAAGLVRTLMPKRWGGFELDFEDAFDIGLEIGKSTCGSSAWCLSYMTDHAFLLAAFPEEAQHDVWSRDPDAGIATSFVPNGQVTPVDGGFRLNGKWPFASGIAHCDWIFVGGMYFGGAEPDLLLFLVPKADFGILDVWQNAGLRGSGSNTVVLDDVFVPVHRTCSFAGIREGKTVGGETNPGWIYHVPIVAAGVQALLSPAIGVARGAYAEFLEWNRGRVAKYTMAQVAEQAPFQIRIAEAEANLQVAEMLVRNCLKVVREQHPISFEQRIHNLRDFTFAVRTVVKATNSLIQVGGATAMYDDNALQRAWRDVQTIACHVYLNFENAAENFGRLQLGIARNAHNPMF
jgi:3-hydroxy-9,10-secoandrosta-1,3,5(10)-triene-9,17-dione monooxygenase